MKNNPFFGYIVSFVNKKSYWIFYLISDFRKETHPKLLTNSGTVRFPYKRIHLLCIHVLTLFVLTICEKKYENATCIINVAVIRKSYYIPTSHLAGNFQIHQET